MLTASRSKVPCRLQIPAVSLSGRPARMDQHYIRLLRHILGWHTLPSVCSVTPATATRALSTATAPLADDQKAFWKQSAAGWGRHTCIMAQLFLEKLIYMTGLQAEHMHLTAVTFCILLSVLALACSQDRYSEAKHTWCTLHGALVQTTAWSLTCSMPPSPFSLMSCTALPCTS